MQDPNEDTEWNDILRAKGILPPKEPEVSEAALTEMIERTIEEKKSVEGRLGGLTVEELDELEDEEDETLLLEFRRRRLEEMKREMAEAKYGEVLEISGKEYVEQVNNAGEGVWVFLHLYKAGIPTCALLNQHFRVLAAKFPKAKFIKSISTTCIPNFPDKNLPAIFIYFEGKVKEQIIGDHEFPNNMSCDELEWRLSQSGGIATTLERNPRKGVKDVTIGQLRRRQDSESSDE